MADDAAPRSDVVKRWIRVAGNVFAAIWVGLGTSFFLIRFGGAFYSENAEGIQDLLSLLPWRP